MKELRELTLSNKIEFREDLNLSKIKYLNKLSQLSISYIQGFRKIIYHNFFNNQRSEIFGNELNNLYIKDIKEIRQKITNSYYKYVDKTYNSFKYKAYYNQLNRECDKYYNQIKYNFTSYLKWIIKHYNNEIQYNGDEIILYQPKRNIKRLKKLENSNNYQLTKEVLEKIQEKLNVFNLTLNDIKEELENKTLLDKISINYKKYNVIPKKYYFKENTDPFISDEQFKEEIEKYGIVNVGRKYKLEKFIYNKYKSPKLSGVSVPLDNRFYSLNFDKENLTSLINSQLILDKSINNQYFLKIKNIISGGKDLKFPIKYNPYVFKELLTNKNKKFNLTPKKFGITLNLNSNISGKDKESGELQFSYNYDLNLNKTYLLESKLIEKKTFNILGYDFGNINTIAGTIIKVEGMDYKDYIKKINENIVKHKKLKHGERGDIVKNTDFNNLPKFSIQKQFKFSAENFNKRVTKLLNEISICQEGKDKENFKYYHKKLNGLKKSWINFIINKLLLEDIDVYIGENLNIKGDKKFGKGFNKKISSMLYGKFNESLSYKVALLYRDISKVFSEYTSTRCPDCGVIHHNNRKSQALFHCSNCGKSGNADLIASLNIAVYSLLGLNTLLI